MMIRHVSAVAVFLVSWTCVRAEEPKLPSGATAQFRLKNFHFAQHGLPIAISPDGLLLAIGSPDVEASVWNIADRKVIDTFKGSDGTIDAVTFSPDGKLLFLAGDEGRVWAWDLESKKQVREFKHGGPIRAIAVDAAGKYLASAGQGPMKLWEVDSGKLVHKFEGHESHLTSVAFAPDGSHIGAGSSDHTVRFWSIKDHKALNTLTGNTAIVSAVAFSQDGRFVVTGSWDQSVRLISASSFKEISDIFRVAQKEAPMMPLPMGGIEARIHCVAFSPDGQTLAFGCEDKKVRLCELATRKVFMELEGHSAGVTHLAFAPDGRSLLSSGKDLNVYRWDLTRQGKPAIGDLQPEELDALWGKLKDADARVAYGAFFKLILAPKNSMPLLEKHLKPAQAVKEERIRHLVTELDSEQFDAREKATQELEGLDEQAEPFVRKKLAGALPNVEMRRRLERILDKIENRGVNAEQVRGLRAVRLLEWINNPEARKLLESLAKGSDGSRLTQAARSALTRLPKPKQ